MNTYWVFWTIGIAGLFIALASVGIVVYVSSTIPSQEAYQKEQVRGGAATSSYAFDEVVADVDENDQSSDDLEDYDTDEAPEPVACTVDAKLCPDGSYVGRIAPTCEFAPCSQVQELGYLTGTVIIGPICPVERMGEPCETPPEAYAARKIIVHDPTNKFPDTEVAINSNGSYSIPLPRGGYVIDIKRIGIDSSTDVPQVITISNHATTTLNINIDTGIR